MAQENREAYIAWLREKLENYCNDDGSYEVYWNYDDSITPDQLVEAVDNWKSEGYTSPESYLASTLYDTVGEAQESQLYVSILDDLNDAPDEVRACWDESTGIWDDLYEAGYTGIIAERQEANRFEVPHLFPDPLAAERFCTYQGIPGDLLRPAMEKARTEYEKVQAAEAPEKAVSLKGEVETARGASAAMADNGNHSNRGQDAR